MSSERLRLLFCDHLNLPRGKYLPASKMADSSSRFSQSVYALTYCKDLIPAPGTRMLEGLGDMEGVYLKDDIRPSWQDGTRVVIADLHSTEGEALPLCGRSLLKRTIGQWEEKKLYPKIGLELEAMAFEMDSDGSWVPINTPGAYVYGTGPMTDPYGFLDIIWHTAIKLGFNLDCMTSEFDSPQFEFTLTYDDALKAVDDIFLFKLMAREIAFEQGILLTFMPQPIEGIGGNGLHVNFSLNDEKGNNVMADSEGERGVGKIVSGCVAGLMKHHQALAGLIAPTVNSYARLKPASMSGFWQNWGFDHRGVTTRVSTEGGKKARIEHRMGDAGCNTYTQVAAVLQAALLGVNNNYPLSAPETGDCLESQDAELSTAETLVGALAHLEQDKVLSEAVGQELVDHHVVLKGAEAEKLEGKSVEEVRDYYLHYI